MEKEIEVFLENCRQQAACSKRFVLVIDGMSAAGKTTLGKTLAKQLDANLISMDEFFLPSELRRKKQIETLGFSIHYERFKEEVLKHLSEDICYHRYHCKTDTSEEIHLPFKKIIIIEGAYSMHPLFGKYYDAAIFMKLSKSLQEKRITIRNPENKTSFFNKWIPLEEAYFKNYEVEKLADLILFQN